MAVYGCSEDFITLAPEDQYTSSDFFSNVDEFELAVLGVYSTLYDIYEPDKDTFPILLAQMSDDVNSNYIDRDFELFKKDFGDSFNDVWRDHFKIIYRVNVMLERAGDVDTKTAAEEEEMQYLLSEARTLRALAYFNIVRFYGKVPKIDFFIEDPAQVYGIGTAAIETIYEDIIVPDLNYAAENGAEEMTGDKKGRYSKYVALSLLGKVELTRGNFAEAETALAKVVNSGVYELVPFSELFRDGETDAVPFNKESIIEIAYKAPEKGSRWNKVIPWELRDELGITDGGGFMILNTQPGSLYQGYLDRGETDRFLANIDTTFTYLEGALRTHIYVKKYVHPNTTDSQNTSYYVLRYADVLLMYAEALIRNGKPGEALTHANQVRQRANMPDFTASDMTVDTILEERRYELALEGHRWLDMMRTGKVDETIGKFLMDNGYISSPIPEFQYYFPIPERERNLDPTIPQTPGY